jgi:amidase
VEGAEPGDILRIAIDSIEVRGSATMASPSTKILPIRGGRVFVGKGLSIPFDPMIGVIGTAPEYEGVPTTTPGEHGGNMDCREIRAGRVVYLPVHVEGALFAAGDVHALQGDGEVCGCGAEVAASITLRAWPLDAPLPTPCVETDEHLIFIASAKTLDECEELAIEKAQGFLTDLLGMEPEEALRMMSLVGDLGVCQVVDPLKTMRFAIPRLVLEPLGLASVKALAPPQ